MAVSADPVAQSPPRSAIERFLGLFTEVRAGEGPTALLMFVNVFLILCAYYFVKPLREGWIAVSDISGLSKMEVKAYTSFAQSIFLLFVVGWYGRLAGRWDRTTLITRATLFCISNLIVFWFLQPDFFIEALPFSGIVFYVWVGMFGVFVVAQFWTFCADVYTDERGRRLLPMIAIGATSGGVVGSRIVSYLVDSGLVPTEALLLLATMPLLASIGLTQIVDRRETARSAPAARAGNGVQDAVSIIDGARLVMVSRFMLAAAVVTLLTNWVNTNGENLLFRVVQEALAGKAAAQGISDPQAALQFTRDGTTIFYGDFFSWVNSLALILQAFAASRLLKYGGFATIALMLPVIALLSYSAMVMLPVLAIVKTMKIAENATDYSINNTARHVLWLPVSAEMKYRGKPAIDTLYARLGDGLAAVTVLVAIHVFALSVKAFLLFNLLLAAGWIVFTLMMIREHRRASKAAADQTQDA
ncbi:MAG: Npt1/Npt2 family nucleotide transporter [Desulfobacterales bacterium]|nr:Npt1/Npt2 family nucleotide transporter [Desulfobacterales bacterium]